jgi:hypothetical protein
MFELSRPKTDSDIEYIEKEIARLKRVVEEYRVEQFKNIVQSKTKSMIIPLNCESIKYNTHYELDSNSITYFQYASDYFYPRFNVEEYPDYSQNCNRTFPIIESWKNSKSNKSTSYILYDSIRENFLYLCIKDDKLKDYGL